MVCTTVARVPLLGYGAGIVDSHWGLSTGDAKSWALDIGNNPQLEDAQRPNPASSHPDLNRM
ncbi:hypothetical protein PG996_003533 [Apiospora saccharicola]|uniref:Uncharacterized protein n=1 Tax=Apiospora saccharicola TaxID=335842 RepID=A0ABR1W1K8_9PEZI